MKLLIPVTDKHAPIYKMTVKTVKSLWINEELKKDMVEMRQKEWQKNLSAQPIDKSNANSEIM